MIRLQLSLEERVLRWTEAQAAAQGVSVSRLITRILRGEKIRQEDYERAMKRWFAGSAGEPEDESGK